MAHHTKEDCIRLGIPLADIKHRMTRRATWKKYWREGTYGITIHLNEEAGLTGLSFGQVVGDVNVRPLLEDFETHPRRGENEKPNENGAHAEDTSCSQSSLTEMKAPHTDLSPLGRIVDRKIREIGTHLHEEDVIVTHHVVMPSHIHFIVEVRKPLPMHHQPSGKVVRWTLSDIIKGFEKGCTSWYYRYLEGESIEEIFANPTKRRASKEPPMVQAPDGTMLPMPSIWNSLGYNDKILMTEERLASWQTYLCYNPYYWRLQDVYPELFEHKLHLMVGETDYSAYGCMFLLGKPERAQIFCHRLARREQLTDEEWQKATASWDAIRAFENYSRKEKLGHFDRDWYRSDNPNTITAVPYARTEAFRKQKAELLAKCEQENAVLVSPAISPGEAEIFYAALEQGYSCIKLVARPIPEKGHAVNKDREYCAHRQLLVLGPWDIPDAGAYASRFGNADSQYAKFHNLNNLAKLLCEPLEEVVLKEVCEERP